MDLNTPEWDLSSVYPSFDSEEYRRDCGLLKERIAGLESPLDGLSGAEAGGIKAETLLNLISAFDAANDYAGNLSAYAEAVYTADTRNERARAEICRLDALRLPLGKNRARFRNILAANKEQVMRLATGNSGLAPYAFFLSESITKAAFQMETALEDLANDLCRSGGDAWSRLHEALASTASAVWDAETGGRKTATELRALARNEDRETRRRAYAAEIEAWKTVEVPMAAALNGVKGHALTVDKRRGWKSPQQKSALQSRISEKTLSSLISAIESSLPLFRRYLKSKAKLLGVERCAFFDLFAPVNSAGGKVWTWNEACDFVTDCLGKFDPAMAEFARAAYAKGWADAGMRDGKIGGAYCTSFPLAKESRILCNFDGTFDAALTLAHETGHAWHHEVIKDLPSALSAYPMTLAETASLFAETLVFEEAVKTSAPSEKLNLIEGSVRDSCQTLVDILSRYRFEAELLSRRENAELSAAELCAIMLDAQKKTYGDALDPENLHPYMWAAKIHYYSPALQFYNYPYAFGHLFALSLYARGREDKSFAGTYRGLLEETGRCTAEDLASKAGFDVSSADFWRQGIDIIKERILFIERSAA
ncbi:MAG: M3 family oligoendopeptidase [Spirochaetaceae bacterium]|jgi:pepF/M3 family oligoendopeptidase|nr:M3 family oligoendopeptidase [Spirochaetaceae bacterium]